MLINQIIPFLRYVRKSNFTPIDDYVCSCDYHFYYVLNGSGKLIIDNIAYEIVPAMAVIILPGTKYLFKNYKNLNIIDYNFDYTQNKSYIEEGIVPSIANEFDEKSILDITVFEDFDLFNRSIVMYNVHFIHKEMNEILNEFTFKKRYYRDVASGQFKIIIFKLARFLNSNRQLDSKINLVLDYIHEHYSEEIDNKRLADVVGYHPYYINSLVKLHTGVTLRQYVINYRLEMAKCLLNNTDISITEVAEKCGYINNTYFSATFKSKVGMSAQKYRNETKNLL